MTIYMMCGIPGSGKSTIAKKLNLPIISLDNIRKEWYGNTATQDNGNAIYQEALRCLHNYVNDNIDVVYDATNINAKRRKKFIKEFEDVDIICVYLNTPLNKSIEQNSNRDRKVPQKVIDRMYRNFEIPTKEEGFKKVITIY